MPARRTRTKRAAALTVVALALVPAKAHAASLRMTAREQSFLHAVNAARAAHSVPRVRVDADLQRAARSHSADMVTRRYFAHGEFARRLRRFGATRRTIGEDLGWSMDDGRAIRRIVGMWLANPAHRAVLLRPGFRFVGLGVTRGPFMGRSPCVVVTADFEGT